MTTTTNSLQCPLCNRWRSDFEGTGSCEAFPEGIKLEVYNGEVPHNEPISGDHGIRFELTKDPRRLASLGAAK